MNAAATGAPGEITCAACHAGGSGGGSLQLEIINGPTTFQPGVTYTLRASLQAPGALVGGMQIVALDGNNTVGQWLAPTGMRALSVSTFGNAARDYLEHSSPKQATSQGLVSWVFDWKAPVTLGHNPVFYASSVAANDDFTPNGDRVFQSYFSMGSLPVEWGSFELKALPGAVTISWETLAEINTQSFEVQRSLDGDGFETLTSLAAEGEAARYQWTDRNPAIGKEIFYRIKQTDIDGQFAFTEVKQVKLGELDDGLSAMYPSVVTEGRPISFEFNAEASTQLRINIQQLDGRSIISQVKDLGPGLNYGTLATGQLKRGQYVVVFSTKNVKEVKRFFILD